MLRTAIEIGSRVGGAVAGLRKLEDRQTRLGRTLQATRRQAAALRGRAVDLRSAQQRLGDSTGALARDLEVVGRRLEKARRRMGEYRREMRDLDTLQRARAGRLRTAAMLGTVGVGARMAGSILTAEHARQTAAVRIGTLLPERERAGGRAAADQAAGDYARRGLTTATEHLQIQYQLVSAGLGAELSRSAADVVAQVATITDGVPGQVGDVVATAWKNLGRGLAGDQTQQISQVGAILTRTQQRYQIENFGQLGQALAEVSARAAAAQLPLDQAAAAVGLLHDGGLKAGRAGTALSATLRQLGPAAEKLGFALERDARGGLDLGATLGGLSRQLKGLDVDARNAALQRAFGDEGFSGVQILLDKLPGLRAGLLDLADTSGVLDDGMRQFLDTPAGRLQTMQANVAELRTALTKGAAPVERFAVGMAQGLAGAAKEYPRAAAGIGLVGSAVGAAVAAVVGAAITRGVWWAWLELGRSVRMVRKAAILSRAAILLQAGALRIGAGATWAWTIAQRALNLAMRLNPIGLVITGVVLLAGVVWRYWGPISRFAGRMWDGMRAGFGRAWEWIRGFFAGGPLAVLRRLAGFHPLAIGVRLMAAAGGRRPERRRPARRRAVGRARARRGAAPLVGRARGPVLAPDGERRLHPAHGGRRRPERRAWRPAGTARGRDFGRGGDPGRRGDSDSGRAVPFQVATGVPFSVAISRLAPEKCRFRAAPPAGFVRIPPCRSQPTVEPRGVRDDNSPGAERA